MKLAVTGKGGVGKTSLTAILAHSFKQEGKKVLVVDADPATSLASVLGYPNPEKITPISEMKELIKERMGVDDLNNYGLFFKLNPKVDDIPEKYWIEDDGIKLLVMGSIVSGGSGCACPQNAFLKTLLRHMFLARDEYLIVDMEAGVEHLGRGTAGTCDALIVVVEPSKQSIETGRKIAKLARDINIQDIYVLGNKVRSDIERDFIRKGVDFGVMTVCLPYSEEILLSSMEGAITDKIPVSVMDEVEKLKKVIVG